MKQGDGDETYADDGRIIGDCRRLVLLGRFFYSQVLDICATEYDVLVYLIRWRDIFLGPSLGSV